VNADVIKLRPECQVTTQAQADSAACAPGKSTSRGGNATRAGSKMSPAYQNLCKRHSAFGMPILKTRSDQERVCVCADAKRGSVIRAEIPGDT
jgi:hypothetical protein